MKRTVGILLFCCLLIANKSAFANSYLDMLTTAPVMADNQQSEGSNQQEIQVRQNPNWWYDSRITTVSPVVVSPYPKYYAWLRAQANEGQFDQTHENIQNLIYVIEGGLVGWGLYEIYK